VVRHKSVGRPVLLFAALAQIALAGTAYAQAQNVCDAGPAVWGDAAGRRKIDFDGDDDEDYCRVVGRTGAQSVCCTLTKRGALVGGEHFVERWMKGDQVLSAVIDPGQAQGREWVDVSGDGLPDYCRMTVNNTRQLTVRCLLNDRGRSFGRDITSPIVETHAANTRMWSDPDEDGRFDFCYRTPQGKTGEQVIHCLLAKTDFVTKVSDIEIAPLR
jgi:hypothetical protein